MAEISCLDCGSCCRGPLTMELDSHERRQLESAGSILQPVAEPVAYDREEVIYPIGVQIYPDRQTLQWLVQKGREYEPLRAHYGRYLLMGACGNLQPSQDGEFTCAIYGTRPKACRDFEKESDKCQILRETKLGITRKKPFSLP